LQNQRRPLEFSALLDPDDMPLPLTAISAARLYDPPGESKINEIKRYIGFGPTDEEHLQALAVLVEPRIDGLLDRFYEAIDGHDGARRVFKDPVAQGPRQRRMLAEWVRTTLRGPWDTAYAARRVAIGKAHVTNQMPQRYMVTAMNVVRGWFLDVIFETHRQDPAQCHASMKAIERVLDLELTLMLDTYRDDMLARMQRQERLATIGEIGASIHHELKNPLAAIASSAFALGERRAVLADGQARELVRKIESNVARSARIVNDMLSYARLAEPSRHPHDLEDLLREAVGRVRLPGAVALTLDIDPQLPPAIVDRVQIEQILVNLLTNAVEACGGRGNVVVTARSSDHELQVQVLDGGVGLQPGQLEQLFEPLFTTKSDGVGLGLSLSRHLAHANRGTLALQAGERGGAVATLTLPAGA
jgi:signal transduction histidine kinase